MQTNCQNCNRDIVENFCSNCGQKSFKRINKKYILDELQYTLIHTNKGFLYTIKNLIKNPGKTARFFIEGDRINHYKPISLLFILSTISSVLMFKVLDMNTISAEYYSKQKMSSLMMNDVSAFMSSYYSFIMMLLVPFFALCTWLVLKKWGNNYYEHIVINSYILSMYTIIYIVLFVPVLYFIKSDHQLFIKISTFTFLIFPVVFFWFFKGFYPEKSLKEIILKSILIFVLVIIAYFILIFASIIVFMIYYAITKSPQEMMNYIKPNK